MQRFDFIRYISSPHPLTFFFVTSSKCPPCKKAYPIIQKLSSKYNIHIIDSTMPVFAFLKSIKQVPGTPTVLAYSSTNSTVYADKCVIGFKDAAEYESFFASM